QNLKRYETGPVETFYRNGTLSSEWILDPKTGRGTFKTYTPEGRPWMIIPFVDNVLEGELKTFYREGPLFSGETYHAGAKDGAEKWQYKNGKPWLDVAWRPGETALLSAFYSENGQRVDLPEVQNEQTPGYFKAFDEQGREVINLQQGGGEQSLVLKSYYETGSLSAEVGLKGKRLSGRVTRYYPDGTVWMETEFTDPRLVPNKTVYFENKAIAISETLIIEPQAEFEWKSYYPGGKIFWQLTKVMNQDQPQVFQLITHWQDEPSADIKKERVLL
nr:hypothetical protein [Candidatus Omnitrophota bacterium]